MRRADSPPWLPLLLIKISLTRSMIAIRLYLQRTGMTICLLHQDTLGMQGRTMPTRAAHAASYVGSPLVVGVTAPNIHQAKYQLEMNSNSYVGQLRQQVASKPAFNIPPQRLRMFLGGTRHWGLAGICSRRISKKKIGKACTALALYVAAMCQ